VERNLVIARPQGDKSSGEDAKAFKRSHFSFFIFHFSFVILDLPLKEIGSNAFSAMANLKLQMKNEK
jgi:hypothetical protein